ncbi:uncharacterized protein LOC122855494 isoform X2 [Aphidius gifuensis]|uniref:uncharacterized protein LOC122855494 isoform X2 n=1 Tax=Aphidius gifuensis TaxID=684658 RepID=UPI001CDCEE20|nr:uncharacterized protein LOC122855494 isoform X2 [Aphidius gifuensis]
MEVIQIFVGRSTVQFSINRRACKKFNMTTTMPSTNEEISRRNTFFSICSSVDDAAIPAICTSLYGIISTLLLPLTVRGPIGGQYGVLILVLADHDDPSTTYQEFHLLTLTDMSISLEMFLISMLFFAHLIGFISVIKKWMRGLVFYSIFCFVEFVLSLLWLANVLGGHIKSHVMSQYTLGWYCFFAVVIQVISCNAVDSFCDEGAGKNKKSDEELPSIMVV